VTANKEKAGVQTEGQPPVGTEVETTETKEESSPENETVGEAAAGEASEDLKGEESTEG